MVRIRQALLTPLIDENPVTFQILGICSAVAITTSLYSALVMSLALTSVLAYSNVTISLMRRHLPRSVRIIVQMTVIASGVIVVDEFLQAFAPETARTLSVFVGQIVTNCIVLGRAESFAAHNRVGISFLDGIGNGMGFSLILITVAIIRELFGTGSLMQVEIFKPVIDGGWFEPNALALLPPSAFFIIGFIIWGVRSWKPKQVERSDFQPLTDHEMGHE
ncbi:MAG: NADH:ubiquinone reductase (Na(+)-transporting) subunit D [Gammaproteobacteria bacterium]|nr:NADH:ubiquinone reductase (Na(+)-transporting) subunit D [Gammaproteobacteria bacterium]